MIQRVLRGTGSRLEMVFYADEAAADADAGVTVTVTRDDGTEAQSGSATSEGRGRYTFVLDPQPEVDRLDVVWTGSFDGLVQSIATQVEIVGGFYFALSELRAMPGLSDPTRYTTEKLAAARTAAEDEVEREIGVAFVERYGTLVLAAAVPPVRIRSFVRRPLGGTVAGVALTDAQLAAMTIRDWGQLEWTAGYFTEGSVLRYVHGYSTEPPPEIHDLAMELARHKLLGWRSTVPDQPVDADELGRDTPAGQSADLGGANITDRLVAWRRRHIGPAIA